MELNFKGNNPGASRFGNFINYYQFNAAENRLKLLPIDVMKNITNSQPIVLTLDVGCNAGDLTFQLHGILKKSCSKQCNMLAIDIDPLLIERATEKNCSDEISFLHCNFMDENQRYFITDYLNRNGAKSFHVTFCFSITMWIHLNHGDNGLKSFLKDVCKFGSFIVIEPQPWKCYRSAVKRMKQNNECFPNFNELKIRNDVESFIEQFILNECGGIKIKETNRTEWGRKLIIFEINNI